MSVKRKKPVFHLHFRNLLADELLNGYCTMKRRGPKVMITANKMKNPVED